MTPRAGQPPTGRVIPFQPAARDLTWVGEFPVDVHWPGGTARARCAIFQVAPGRPGTEAGAADHGPGPHRLGLVPAGRARQTGRRTGGSAVPSGSSGGPVSGHEQATGQQAAHWLAMARSALARLDSNATRSGRSAGAPAVYIVVAESPEGPGSDPVRTLAGARRRPRALVRAIRLMEADPSRRFSTELLARAAGVSVRTLQTGFKRHTGMTPMDYLRQLRLTRIHADLLAADPTRATVARIAHRWGISHLGRFASAYRERYGVNPSTTLRSEPGH